MSRSQERRATRKQETVSSQDASRSQSRSRSRSRDRNKNRPKSPSQSPSNLEPITFKAEVSQSSSAPPNKLTSASTTVTPAVTQNKPFLNSTMTNARWKLKSFETYDRFSTYLVSGFVREAMQKLDPNVNITVQLIEWTTVSYYLIVEKFQESENPAIVHTANNCLEHAPDYTYDWCTAIGTVSTEPHSGVYIWSFRVLSPNPCVDFGIFPTNYADNRQVHGMSASSSSFENGGCGFRSVNGQFYANFQELGDDEEEHHPYNGDFAHFGKPLYGKAMATNDVVVMTLDTEQQSLKFAVNNVCYNRAPMDIEDIPYTMIVGLQANKLQLISFRQFSINARSESVWL